jgi:hypothetical protein
VSGGLNPKSIVPQDVEGEIVRPLCECTQHYMGARGSVVVKALCYKPEGRGFETR